MSRSSITSTSKQSQESFSYRKRLRMAGITVDEIVWGQLPIALKSRVQELSNFRETVPADSALVGGHHR